MSSKSLKNPIATFGIIALWIGVGVTIVGVVVFFVLQHFNETHASIVTLAVVSGQGLIWFIIGLVITMRNRRALKLLYELKDTGKQYEAEEITLIPYRNVQINHSPAAYAECIYINDSGQRCRVKSRIFAWNRWGQGEDILRATIYVDRQDPSRYAVEMQFDEKARGQVDVDYT